MQILVLTIRTLLGEKCQNESSGMGTIKVSSSQRFHVQIVMGEIEDRLFYKIPYEKKP